MTRRGCWLGIIFLLMGLLLLVFPGKSWAEPLKGLPYTVRKGDTLWALARQNKVTINDITRLNNLKDPNRIYPGQKIIIPVKATLYRVEKGDSLWRIAKKYNVSTTALVQANKLKNPNLIYPGQIIIIKGAAPTPPPTPQPKPILSGKTVIIDPGHGGKDPGAVGAGGLREKDVTLAIANHLAAKLRVAGAKVIFTRSNDRFVSLPSRVDLSNKSKADIFISIHINSAVNRTAHGTETFYKPDNVRGKRLAGNIQKSVLQQIALTNRGVKSARFYVLRKNNLPSALVEIAFISNYKEENLLRSDSFRQKAATGLYNGIVLYFQGK